MWIKNKEIIVCIGYGKYLGVSTKNQSFVMYDKGEIVKEVEFIRCSMIILSDGNNLSSNALFYAGVYEVMTVLMSQTGRLISTLRPTNSEYDIDLRRLQYDAYNKAKGVKIAKFILTAKIENQIEFMDKHGLDSSKIPFLLSRIKAAKGKKIDDIRSELNMLEANCSKVYFHEYIKLFDEEVVIKKREKRRAKDIFNNVLNLSYEILKIECFRACYLARLDPFMGYLHSTKHGKPSLVCDLQELYRTRIDDFIYRNRKKIKFDDFQDANGRTFLSKESSLELILMLNDLFSKKEKPKTKFGTSPQYEFRTLMKFQGRIIAKYINDERTNIDIKF